MRKRFTSAASSRKTRRSSGVMREDLVDEALAHDRVAVLADIALHQQVDDVAQAHARAIEQVFGVAVAVDAAADFNFGEVERQPAVFVVEREQDFGHADGLRSRAPEKMTSSCCFARRRRMLCSPSTQRMASATLLLPEPFGPTTAVTPPPKSNVVRLAKLLKPWMESFFRYTAQASVPAAKPRDGFQRPPAAAPRACSRPRRARARAPATFTSTRIAARLTRHLLPRSHIPAVRASAPGRGAERLIFGSMREPSRWTWMNVVLEEAQDERARRTVAVSAVDGADHRFQRAGKVPVARASAGGLFARPRTMMIAEVEAAPPYARACCRARYRRACASVRLRPHRETAEELIPDDHPEDSVAKELETFVGVGRGVGFVEVGGVRERLAKQRLGERPSAEALDKSFRASSVASGTAPPSPRPRGTKNC